MIMVYDGDMTSSEETGTMSEQETVWAAGVGLWAVTGTTHYASGYEDRVRARSASEARELALKVRGFTYVYKVARCGR